MGKNVPANPGDAGDAGPIPVWGRPPREGNGTHSSVLAWRVPGTEEAGGLQSTGHKEPDMTNPPNYNSRGPGQTP